MNTNFDPRSDVNVNSNNPANDFDAVPNDTDANDSVDGFENPGADGFDDGRTGPGND